MKTVGKKAWEYIGWFVAVYTIYNQLKTLNQAKNEFYETLDPSQQARWDSILGKPALAKPKPVEVLAAVNAQGDAAIVSVSNTPTNVPPTAVQVLSGT